MVTVEQVQTRQWKKEEEKQQKIQWVELVDSIPSMTWTNKCAYNDTYNVVVKQCAITYKWVHDKHESHIWKVD